MEGLCLCSASLSELLVQADFRPQSHLHFATDTLTAWGDGGHKTFPLLTADLHLANTGDVYPCSAGDFFRQCLQIPFYRLADECFGQAAPLTGDMGNSLGVVHSCLLKIGDKRDIVTT